MPSSQTNKRSRDPSVGFRFTRRSSSGVGRPPLSRTATPDPKRKRTTRRLVVPESSGSSNERERDGPKARGQGEWDEDTEQDDEMGLDEQEVHEVSRRLRNARSSLRSEAGSGDDADSTETEGVDDEQGANDGTFNCGKDARLYVESKLATWPAAKLRTLRRSELVELYLVLPSSTTAHPETHSVTKETLIALIVSARKPPSSALTEISSPEDDSADASPHPRTSHEASPGDEIRPRRARTSTTTTRRPSDARSAATKTRRTVGRKQHPPTPPLTSGEEEEEEEDGDEMVEDIEQADAREKEPRRIARSPRLARRASQVEMPPPPLPTLPAQRHRRTRSHPDPEPEGSKPVLRFGNRMNQIIREEEEAEVPTYTSPVAHRTRNHRAPLKPVPTVAANAHGSPARPGRAAKQRAFARLAARGENGPGTSGDGAEEHDEDMVEGDDDALVASSESDEDEEDSIEDEHARRASGASKHGRRRRPSRAVKQVETPPSDADEESGGEEPQEEPVAVELRSNLRAKGRASKNGRIVKLRNGKNLREFENPEPELGEVDDEDEDMDAEYQDGGDGRDDEEDEDESDVDLLHATSKTLLRRRKADLVRLCEERDLDNSGRTKKELVDALLQWRDLEADGSSDDSDASTNSTLSNASTETARAATKTVRLAAAARTSGRASKNTPLLMREQHPISPEKPRTPDRSKEREQQEDVNALDLESLQLQDKEIPPEKLTKLELVGSGGFKDVYKGTYRRRTIAICDIRGHLTDMDIKELGLLRDLRHENIVQFIGVSIPKQPSAVPVMIVTELCANGDLFDYIRGVEAPPFRDILEILLGIAKGIEYLHTRKPSIIHRDIKSSNVLITSQGVAKIADFGLARIKTSTKSMIRSLVGTVNWQAPELWHPHPRYNEKVDVYSIGLVMWEMLQWHQPVKRYPFEGMNEHAIYADVGQRQLRPSTAGLHRRWGGEIVDLMSKMWDQDPALRPAMSQVVHRLKQLVAFEKAKPRPT
ncbi:hypothetical protein JCM10212_003995 [Sporobolomyces blumeae]